MGSNGWSRLLQFHEKVPFVVALWVLRFNIVFFNILVGELNEAVFRCRFNACCPFGFVFGPVR